MWRAKRLYIISWNPIPVDFPLPLRGKSLRNEDMMKKIAVVGGGAAGMMAAVQAARAGAVVCVYERNDRIGKKILSTGNGKCNFSNEYMDESCYHGSGRKLINSVYEIFGPVETKEFFQNLGMRIKEVNGYLYPASGQASTVLDLFRYELDRLSVDIHTGWQITGISQTKDGIRVETADHRNGIFDAVILTCGGNAAPGTGSDGAGYKLAKRLGHRIVPVVPALTALRCQEEYYKQVAGVRCDASLTLCVEGRKVCAARGELQLTDYGISGIPVFQISRHAAYAVQERKHTIVKISFLPDFGEEDYVMFWRERWKRQSSQTMEMFLTGIVNKKINLLLLKIVGIKGGEIAKNVPQMAREKLQSLYRALEAEVKATNPFEQAQVSAGGVDCAQVTDHMLSKIVPGVYFAGEILDVDGICGGYNLQWAFSSGTVAGLSAAGSLP